MVDINILHLTLYTGEIPAGCEHSYMIDFWQFLLPKQIHEKKKEWNEFISRCSPNVEITKWRQRNFHKILSFFVNNSLAPNSLLYKLYPFSPFYRSPISSITIQDSFRSFLSHPNSISFSFDLLHSESIDPNFVYSEALLFLSRVRVFFFDRNLSLFFFLCA